MLKPYIRLFEPTVEYLQNRCQMERFSLSNIVKIAHLRLQGKCDLFIHNESDGTKENRI